MRASMGGVVWAGLASAVLLAGCATMQGQSRTDRGVYDGRYVGPMQLLAGSCRVDERPRSLVVVGSHASVLYSLQNDEAATGRVDQSGRVTASNLSDGMRLRGAISGAQLNADISFSNGCRYRLTLTKQKV